MNILFYGLNFSPELTGTGKYSGEMVKWMASKDFKVDVITAQPYYPDWKLLPGYKNQFSRETSLNYKILRCPIYIPKNVTTLSRLLHLTSFAISSFFPLIFLLRKKPDVIIQVAPTMVCSLQTLLLSRMFDVKTILHIQDYELDAMLGLGSAKAKSLEIFLSFIEKKLLNNYDLVSTISNEMLTQAEKKGVSVDKLILLRNWVETEKFKNIPEDQNFFEKFGVTKEKKIVLYAGNLGDKQGLENLIFAAQRLRNMADIHFVIVGQGAKCGLLKSMVADRELANVTFLPLQSSDKLPRMLASADCHLVIQKSGVAGAVLPSKLTNILAVGGNVVITADPSSELGVLCADNPGIATLVKPDSVADLVSGILNSLGLPKRNRIAKNYSNSYLDKDRILEDFIYDISKRFSIDE